MKRKRFRASKKHANHKTKTLKIITPAVLIVAASVVYVGTQASTQINEVAPTVHNQVIKAKEEPTEVSTLSGELVSPSLANRHVSAVMIENSPSARPQSGLNEASVVFEAVAEGGITRFLSLFQSNTPEQIGPVRSLRPYYIDWALGFDASVAHVGGSTEATELAYELGIKDLDEYSFTGSYYRDSSRYAPHNAYTSSELLDELNESLGYSKSDFTPWTRKAADNTAAVTAGEINLEISSQLYNVSYEYDQASNTYLRYQGGAPHSDRESNKQLSPDVVVAINTSQYVADDVGRMSIGTVGSGSATIFQDGQVTDASWSKDSHYAMLEFISSSGSPIALNPGQVWITALANGRTPTYSP